MNVIYLLFALLAIILLSGWLRIYRPGSAAPTGGVILIYPMPLLARLRMQGPTSVIAIGIGIALALVWDQSWAWLIVAVVSTIALISVPLQYTLTTTGIRLGWTGLRRWTEFASVRRATGGARLVGGQKLRDMHIWLSDSRGDDEFLQFLRQAIQDAYKGNATVVSYPVQRGVKPNDPLQRERMSAYITEG